MTKKEIDLKPKLLVPDVLSFCVISRIFRAGKGLAETLAPEQGHLEKVQVPLAIIGAHRWSNIFIGSSLELLFILFELIVGAEFALGADTRRRLGAAYNIEAVSAPSSYCELNIAWCSQSGLHGI